MVHTKEGKGWFPLPCPPKADPRPLKIGRRAPMAEWEKVRERVMEDKSINPEFNIRGNHE
jgi:hypothetical protein